MVAVLVVMIEDNDDDGDNGVTMTDNDCHHGDRLIGWLLIEFCWLIISDEDKHQDPSVTQESQVAMSSPLMHIEGLLEALTNADKDGRIVVNKLGWILLLIVQITIFI